MLLQWTRRLSVCLHLVACVGAPLSRVVLMARGDNAQTLSIVTCITLAFDLHPLPPRRRLLAKAPVWV